MPSESPQASTRARLARPAIFGFLFITVLTIGLGLATPAPQWGGLVAMSIFYAATYWLGVWASTRAGDGSFRDMVLAGRRLGLGVGVFTMTATWVDGGYVNGTAEQTYSHGLLAVQAPWGYALSLLIGGLWFAPLMRICRRSTPTADRIFSPSGSCASANSRCSSVRCVWRRALASR